MYKRQVVECDQRRDPGVPQPGELVAVVGERVAVELPTDGFEAGPFQPLSLIHILWG